MAKIVSTEADAELERDLDYFRFLFSPSPPTPPLTPLPQTTPTPMEPFLDIRESSGPIIAGMQPDIGGLHGSMVASMQQEGPTVGFGGIEVDRVDLHQRRKTAKVMRMKRILKRKSRVSANVVRRRSSVVNSAQFQSQEELMGSTVLRYLLEKKLTISDVNEVGRIVIPKKLAEAYLPELNVKDGTTLAIRDIYSRDCWQIKYRYWMNNNSKMYVLENIGNFVDKYDLQQGDIVSLYQDDKNQYFICPKKADGSLPPMLPTSVHDEGAGPSAIRF